MWRYCLLLAAVLLWSGRSCAQLGLTISVQFSTDPSGLTLSGSGTAAATAAFGTVQAYGGTVPTGVTKSVGASNWILSTPIDVLVQKGTLDALSTSYTLTAALQASDLTNTWKLNSVTLSTTANTLTAMMNNKEQAWPIYVNGKIVEVYLTNGTDDAKAKQQATGKFNNIAKDHVAGAVRLDGPFPISRN